jgi:adenylate kinase family enzyme
VVVWGSTGSGKTTLAGRLGRLLGLHVVQLDAIRHERGWDSVDWPEFRERLADVLETHPEGWVTDGSYGQIADEYLSRADTLIWLHLPWRTCFPRLLRRTVSRAWRKEQLYGAQGPRESFRLSFTDRESILWWSIRHHREGVRTTRERLARLPGAITVIELRSAGDVAALLESIEVGAPDAI